MMLKAALLALAMAAVVSASEEEPRFGYLTLGNDDNSLFTFNETSVIQGLVVTGIILLVAFVVLPILGVDFSNIFEKEENFDPFAYAQDFKQNFASPYAKRSLDALSPVISALAAAYKKYQH